MPGGLWNKPTNADDRWVSGPSRIFKREDAKVRSAIPKAAGRNRRGA